MYDKGRQKMKILFYLYQYPAIGGIEAVTAVLAGAFVRHGHKVSILSHVSKKQQFELIDSANTVPHYRMPERELSSRCNVAYLEQLISREHIEILIFQDEYTPIEANVYNAQINNVRVVVCEHNAPYCPPYYPYRRLPFPLSYLRKASFLYNQWCNSIKSVRRKRRLYNHCWRYVLLSSRYFGEFRAMTGFVDTRKLRAIGNPITCLKPVGLREKVDEIVFAGTVEYRKGCDMLVPLFKRLSASHPSWSFTVVGDGPLRVPLQKVFSECVANVRFVGYQPNIEEYLAQAKLFVFPSRREGWGLVLVEAMANGCVPVAFDSFAAVRDIITDGINGVVVPAFDLEAMAHKIESLMGDDAKYAQMSKTCIQSVNAFSEENVMSAWEKVFNES